MRWKVSKPKKKLARIFIEIGRCFLENSSAWFHSTIILLLLEICTLTDGYLFKKSLMEGGRVMSARKYWFVKCSLVLSGSTKPAGIGMPTKV